MNKEKSLYAIIGLLIGLSIGYFGANSLNGSAPAAQTNTSGQSAALPPNHPPTGAASDETGSASSGEGGAQGDVMVAIEQARKDPANFDAQMKAADLFRQINRREGELEFYERAVKIKPNNFDLLTRLGEANLALRKYDEAAKWYEQALKSNPRHEATLQNLTQALIEKGDKAAANSALKQLEQVNPRNPEIVQFRSRLQ
ncbi:MAG: tetratricopeptide repeat protein [Acidobacteria bacterium]|nr:tetratricopeptide repeat protein [Acidobacteriota bacterium]